MLFDDRKELKSAIESEEAMEQTSLACTSTWAPLTEEVCDPGTNLSTVPDCETVPWKGGNFVADMGCTVIPLYEGCIVALS